MAVEGKNRHYHWNGIRLRHWLETARRCGMPEMKTLIREIIDQTPGVLDQVRQGIPVGFPTAIADSILTGLKNAAAQLGGEISQDS